MATPRTVTFTLQTPDGVAVVGKVVLTLNQMSFVSGSNEVAPRAVTLTANASGVATGSVYANSDLSPAGTFYNAVEYDSAGLPMGTYGQQYNGAGPFVASASLYLPVGAPGSAVGATSITGLGVGQTIFGTATTPVARAIAEADVTNLVADLAAKLTSLTAADGTAVIGGTATAPTVKVGILPYAQLSGAPVLLAAADGTAVIGGTLLAPTVKVGTVPVAQVSGAAVDSAVVHLAGAETIIGAKTFNGGLIATGIGPTRFANTGFGSSGGPGLEIGYFGGQAVLQGYNRDGAAYVSMLYSGADHTFQMGGVNKASISSTGLGTFNGGASIAAALAHTGTTVGLNGNAPVAKAAAIASPTSDTVGTKAAIDALRAAVQAIGITA